MGLEILKPETTKVDLLSVSEYRVGTGVVEERL